VRRATVLLIIGFLLGAGSSLSPVPLLATPAETAAEIQLPEEPKGSQGEDKDEKEEEEEEEEEEEPGLIDITHERVSEAIMNSAQWIDSFFSGERAIQEETETRFRLGISNFTGRGDLLQTDVHTSFRLDLPVMSDRLHLLFAGDEEDDPTLTPERRARSRVITQREREASVSLRYFLLTTLRRNASLSTGLRFRNGSPIFLFEPRYREVFPLSDWDLRFTQRFRAYTDDRLEIRTSFDLERPFNNLFFRATADGIWIHAEPGYFYNFHISLYQPLSKDRMLLYLWSNNFATRPAHALNEVLFLIAYRQRIWREWLFVEVSPQIAYPREEDYEFSPGFMLRFDIIFGDFPSFRINDI
jgi:hypothetical protein